MKIRVAHDKKKRTLPRRTSDQKGIKIDDHDVQGGTTQFLKGDDFRAQTGKGQARGFKFKTPQRHPALDLNRIRESKKALTNTASLGGGPSLAKLLVMLELIIKSTWTGRGGVERGRAQHEQ